VSDFMKVNRHYYPSVISPLPPKEQTARNGISEKAFSDVFKDQLAAESHSLQFSRHALDRMHGRGINLSTEQMSQLEKAVEKAAQKGGKETLIVMKDVAFIVSTIHKTVITAIDDKSLKDHVFTKIDSTILI